jgi:hypothetical protein
VGFGPPLFDTTLGVNSAAVLFSPLPSVAFFRIHGSYEFVEAGGAQAWILANGDVSVAGYKTLARSLDATGEFELIDYASGTAKLVEGSQAAYPGQSFTADIWLDKNPTAATHFVRVRSVGHRNTKGVDVDSYDSNIHRVAGVTSITDLTIQAGIWTFLAGSRFRLWGYG